MKLKPIWTFALLAVTLVGGFFLLFESVEREVVRPPGPEARANPWLAAERFLERLGTSVQERRSLRKLPSTDTAILLVASRENPTEESRSRLLDWVADGGHLIVSWEHETLLYELGIEIDYSDLLSPEEVSLEGTPSDAPTEGTMSTESPIQDAPIEDASVQDTQIEDTQPEETQEFLISAREETPPRSLRLSQTLRFRHLDADADTPGEVYLRASYGSGQVSALNEFFIFHNDEIGENEHAVFLWEMLAAPNAPALVWRITAEETPSLFTLLYEHAWTLLLSAAFWLFAFLWMRGARFGPTLDLPPPGRRSLREHLTASGYFLWRHGLRSDGNVSALLEPLRTAVRRRYAHLPLPEEARNSLSSEVSEPVHFVETVHDLHRLLQDPKPMNPRSP